MPKRMRMAVGFCTFMVLLGNAAYAEADVRAREITARIDKLVRAADEQPLLSSRRIWRDQLDDLLTFGPAALPQVIAALSNEATDLQRSPLKVALYDLTQIALFPYSRAPYVINGIDYFESTRADLPEASFCINPDEYDSQKRLSVTLKIWNSRDELPSVPARLEKLRQSAGVQKTAAAEITGEDYRVFLRETCTKGILELPVLIQLVCSENSLLAFHQFMRLSGGPSRKGDTDPLADLAWLNEHYPNAADRKDCVRLWWSTGRDTYTGLSTLQHQIDEAVGCLTPASD